MAKASDVLASEAKDVLDQIIANIEIEDSNDTMSKSETTKMTEEKALIQKLQDEKKELQDQIKELEEKKDVNTEKPFISETLGQRRETLARSYKLPWKR